VIAGVGVLLLAMGVGVLIGRTGASSPSAATTSPPVVTITASTTTSSTETAESATGSSSGKGSSAKTHHSKPAESSKGVGSSIEKPAPSSVLTKLKESEKSGNGKKYEQESNHLPNVVSTG
jgi:hypothetical protein